jgi:transmembrane protein TMEM260 (protein O-mannosyltransferase)
MKPRDIFAVVTFIIVFSVYLVTLAPTVTFIDSGELAAVASTLGIAHPTGYPLFTILGYLFSRLPISPSEIYKLNLMGALLCAGAIVIFYYLMNFLFSFSSTPAKEDSKKKESRIEISPELKVGLCVFSSLVLAFSNTFWAQANSVEVYSLHIFFVIALMYSFVKAITMNSNKMFLLFSFILGLSFTNHMTTILLAPACLTLFFVTKRNEGKEILKLIGYMVLCFAAGFSVYLYLPIRASMQPLFLWGNPYNLERFIWHISGKQFSVWIFSAKGSVTVFVMLLVILEILTIIGLIKKLSLSKNYHFGVFLILSIVTFIMLKSSNEIVVKQFNLFVSSLVNEYGKWVSVLGLIGVYRLSRANINVYYFTILAFFSCVVYSVNYDIHDISSYFLLAYIIGAIWIGFGALLIYERAAKSLRLSTRTAQITFATILVLCSVITLSSNFAENDESNEYAVEQFTMNVFKNAEPSSIIISSQWDFWVSASWYYQVVKHIRPDLIIIDKELLRRSWYYVYLQRHYPEVYENSKPEIERFLAELYKFEHNIPYDQKTIMKAFNDLLTGLVEKNPSRKVYTTWEIEQNKDEVFAQNYERIPDGILLQLFKKESTGKKSELKTYDFNFTKLNKEDYYHETIMNTYAFMLASSANHFYSQNRIEDARKYVELSLKAKPDLPQALELKKKLY